MLKITNVCSLLGGYFGKAYDNVTLEKIDGSNMAVHHTGVDFINLSPKDTDCSWFYIREKEASSINMVDLGGCEKTPFIKQTYRFVAYDKKAGNNFAKVQLFVKAMSGLNIEITNVITNADTVYNQESSGKKNIRLKNISYIAVDFSTTEKIDLCDIQECQ